MKEAHLLTPVPQFFSQIEEIGWEHLVRLAEDLSFVTFRVM